MGGSCDERTGRRGTGVRRGGLDGRRLAARPRGVQRRRAAARDHPAGGHRRGAHARLDGPRGDAAHPHRGARHLLVAVPAGVLAQGRHVGPRAVRARRRARLRRRHPARAPSSRSAPPATPARAPASTATRSRSPWHPRPSTDHAERRRGDRVPPPPRASRSSPRCCPGAASCPSRASSSPTARRPSASTASSPSGRPGTFLLESAEQGGIWSRYSFVGASSYGVLTERDGRVEWQDYGLSAERALGDAADARARSPRSRRSSSAGAPRTCPAPRRSPAGSSGSSGGRRSGRSSTCPNRPPADFRMPGQAFSFVSELVVIDHRTGTVQLVASALNDGDDAPEALWVDAQDRLDRHAATASRARRRRGSPRSTSPRRPTRRTAPRRPTSSPRSSARRSTSARATSSRS